MSRLKLFPLILVILVVVTACLPVKLPTVQPTTDPGQQPQPPVTNPEPAATATLEPQVVLPTETPYVQSVTVTVSQNTNCRNGPGANYDFVYSFTPYDSAVVIGKDFNGQYWVIQLPDGKTCWLFNQFATVVGDTGGLPLPVVPPSPTPAPIATWAGTYEMWFWYNQFGTDIRDIKNVVITQTGNTMEFQFTANPGQIFKFTGTVSPNGTLVTGSFTVNTAPGQTFTFSLERVAGSTTQFRGRYYIPPPFPAGTDGDLCGASGGGAKPDPCRR